MNEPLLRVLCVEDSEDDVALLLRELRRSGYTVQWQRVEDQAELAQALAAGSWDVVLADFSMPQFDALAALDTVQQLQPNLPFIIVSGSIGEETAVSAVKAGVYDYVMKDNYARLVPAIERGLREAAMRRQRQQAEEALRESEERWLFALEGSGDGVWDWNMQTNQVFFSPRWKEMLGYSNEELGNSLTEWTNRIHPEDWPQTNAAIRQHVLGESPVYLTEHRLRAKDGSYRWIQERGKLMTRTGDGQPLRFVGTATDISERKRAEAEQAGLEMQLRQSQKMEALGTLAGGIAHDFNNILAAIMSYTTLLEADLGDNADARVMLHEISRASNRARELIRQILAFSRQQEQQRRVIQLQPVITEALTLLRATIPSSIEMNVRIDPHVPPVLADESEMHQVMLNLATNAAYAMDGGAGQLEVSYSSVCVEVGMGDVPAELRPGPHVRLAVRDTGCGMDKQTLERIFEPFYTTREPGKGTGLGLAVVHGIVKNHGGAITVESRPGQGSTFTVYLPVVTDTSPVAGFATAAGTVGRGQHVLYIDDEVLLVRPIKTILERKGYRVTSHTNSLEALADFAARSAEFDLVITDLTMPHLDGLELACRMQQIQPELPMLLVTGFGGLLHEEAAQVVGVRRVLLKPFSTEMLLNAIEEALNGS
ncbi:MAG: response regulator [Chloroflexaceae bacterium]|nr:response regulator [Chloroflexaceae bacterium]